MSDNLKIPLTCAVACYPQPGKRRSVEILQAFAEGCGRGYIADPARFRVDEPAAFYGTLGGIDGLVRQAQLTGQRYYFLDNAYFDGCRGIFYRCARDELQPSTVLPPNRSRFVSLGLDVLPWRKAGVHVVVVEQSPHHLALAGAGRNWLARTVEELSRYTDRPLRIRGWMASKDDLARTLAQDLSDAHALVTHSSAAANMALLSGVPVFCTGRCAATPLSSGPVSGIESPTYADGREAWARGLAGAQFTIDEMTAGAAWRWIAQHYGEDR